MRLALNRISSTFFGAPGEVRKAKYGARIKVNSVPLVSFKYQDENY